MIEVVLQWQNVITKNTCYNSSGCIYFDDSIPNISNHTFVLLQNEAKSSTATATDVDARIFAANIANEHLELLNDKML